MTVVPITSEEVALVLVWRSREVQRAAEGEEEKQRPGSRAWAFSNSGEPASLAEVGTVCGKCWAWPGVRGPR